jgi:hypothetical protein
MHPVKQIFPNQRLSDIAGAVRSEIARQDIRDTIKPGQSVAVLVGSRGIASLAEIVKHTIATIKDMGAEPFIVPAMGSHGEGDAEKQQEIIEGYGVTESYTGAPIRSSMETIVVGYTSGGIPVHVDKTAAAADAIVPVARVKVHTDFDAPIESGLCKMLAIGAGKHNGCSRLHMEGFVNFPRIIPEVASVILENVNIAFGIAIIENAHEYVHSIHAVRGTDFLSKEATLLTLSRSLMPRLQFDEIDVLIVERIGKDITGAGMDPNITGRTSVGRIKDFSGPSVKRIVVFDLSPGSHHNATGIGCAHYTVKRLFDKIDLMATYANCIASGNPEAGRIPIMMDSEDDAIRAAISTATGADITAPKIVRIQDTLHLINIQVSDALYEQCASDTERFSVIE